MTNIKPVKLDFKILNPSVEKNKSSIILLHGISANKMEFDDIASDLSNRTGRRLYMLDLRNHGDSEHSDVFHFDAMAVDVINFMDEHNIKSASIFGHSMGGRLAALLALTYPERVENVIIEDMTPKAVPKDIMDGYNKLLTIFRESIDIIPPDADLEKATLAVFMHVFSRSPKNILTNMKMRETKGHTLPMMKKDGKFIWKTNFPAIMKAMELNRLQFCENLKGLFQNPALFIYGTLSEFKVGDDKDFILKLFPQAQLHGLATSHAVHSESPQEFVQAVENFLK